MVNKDKNYFIFQSSKFSNNNCNREKTVLDAFQLISGSSGNGVRMRYPDIWGSHNIWRNLFACDEPQNSDGLEFFVAHSVQLRNRHQQI